MKIANLMVHCTATPEGIEYETERILGWFKDRGWKNPGYRAVTHLDGVYDILQEFDHDVWMESGEITNGARGWNSNTIHLSYVGGVERHNTRVAKDTRTKEQKDSLEAQIKSYLYLYPNIKIMGHNQIARKACPSFNVPAWCREIGIPERNIYSNDLIIPPNICAVGSDSYVDEDNAFDFNHNEQLYYGK